jgi:hypothetical protein
MLQQMNHKGKSRNMWQQRSRVKELKSALSDQEEVVKGEA